MRKSRATRIVVAVALVWGLLPIAARPTCALPSFSDIVVFGDSYSDSGNVGRSTDAENWVESLAASLEIPGAVRPSSQGGSNYASAGGRALGLGFADFRSQLRNYAIANPTADPDALHVVWLGFNDIILADEVDDPAGFADSIAAGILTGMSQLYRLGARHFLVPTPWDPSLTPVMSLLRPLAERAQSRLLADLLAERLSARLDAFFVPVIQLDALTLSRRIAADPSAFGATRGALEVCPDALSSCDGYVWRDLVHPTSFSHRIVARNALVATPEPGSALLLGLGLAGLAGRRTHRRGAAG